MKYAVALALIILCLGNDRAAAHNLLSTQQWRSDLHSLVQGVTKMHPGAFHDVQEAAFNSEAESIDRAIPALSDHEIEVRLIRLIAMLGEGHSRVQLPGLRDPMSDNPTLTPYKFAGLAFHQLPLKLQEFSDGLYVTDAPAQLHALIGSKVIAIGGHPILSVLDAVRPLANHDNEMGVRLIAPDLVIIPEILQALHIIPVAPTIPVTLMTAGKTAEIDLTPTSPATASAPIGNFWVRYEPESAAVYAKINVLQDMPHETVAGLAAQIVRLANSNSPQRYIIDFRGCRGGNLQLFRSLLLGIIRSPQINQLGKLFVLIDRGSFSAAVNSTSDLERLTNAILVGEPTGGAPGSWGDPKSLKLPNSGLIARISTVYWSDWTGSARPWIAPDIPVPLISTDYFAGRDPALAAATAFSSSASFADLLDEIVRSGGRIGTIDRLYYRHKTDTLWVNDSTEGAMQRAGADLVRAGAFDDALQVFEINYHDYPRSLDAALQEVRAQQRLSPSDRNLTTLLTALERLQSKP